MAFYDPENITDPVLLEEAMGGRILQPIWSFLKDGREDILRNNMFPPVVAVSAYILSVIPFSILDVLGNRYEWVKKYKIQKDKKVSLDMWWGTFLLHFWNHAIYIFPMALVQSLWIPPTPLPPVAPKLWPFIWQQVVWFFMFDAYYWALHWGMHKNRFLYRWVHAVHHQYQSPFAAMTNHLHPAELIAVGMGITVIPWAFQPHIMTYWCWFIVATYVSVEVHSGYDLPFTADKLLPSWLYDGAVKHDNHHLRPLSNYEPWMGHLDKIFGLDLNVRELVKDEKNATKGVYLEGEEDDMKKYN